MPTKEPSYIQACSRCNSKKIKCLVREGGACEQCSALDVECVYGFSSHFNEVYHTM
jgi:hypothetical protein